MALEGFVTRWIERRELPQPTQPLRLPPGAPFGEGPWSGTPSVLRRTGRGVVADDVAEEGGELEGEGLGGAAGMPDDPVREDLRAIIARPPSLDEARVEVHDPVTRERPCERKKPAWSPGRTARYSEKESPPPG